MRVRFIGEPDGDRECVAYGMTFPEGEWVDIGKEQARLATNPMFEADADEDGEADPSVDEMRAELTELGVAFHPRSGARKLAALLAKAREEQTAS